MLLFFIPSIAFLLFVILMQHARVKDAVQLKRFFADQSKESEELAADRTQEAEVLRRQVAGLESVIAQDGCSKCNKASQPTQTTPPDQL